MWGFRVFRIILIQINQKKLNCLAIILYSIGLLKIKQINKCAKKELKLTVFDWSDRKSAKSECQTKVLQFLKVFTVYCLLCKYCSLPLELLPLCTMQAWLNTSMQTVRKKPAKIEFSMNICWWMGNTYIIEMSTICDFHSTPSINIHCFNFRRFYLTVHDA